ncbi:hypothetical protein [Streptomyces sp. NBC_00212]|uniref:hypothetical protein n=1 Tax=Streptomyces sp. NBC_00212 TaxID=2975684 RepID=UPI002F910D01
MKTRDDVAGAADQMSDLMALMLKSGVTGWVAVGLEDGWYDSIVYSTREGAEGDQTVPSTYVRIPEVRFGQFLDCPVLVSECADYLRFADALRDVAPSRTPIVPAKAGGLIGTPVVKWGAEIRKVTRRPGKQPQHATVNSAAMWRDLVLHLPGGACMASTDGSVIYLSIREPNQFPCEISYTPTGS